MTALLDYGPTWTVMLAVGLLILGARFAARSRADRRRELERRSRRRRYAGAASATNLFPSPLLAAEGGRAGVTAGPALRPPPTGDPRRHG